MAELSFPSNPTLGQIYTSNGRTWRWAGDAWLIEPGSIADIGDVDVTAPAAGEVLTYNGTTWGNGNTSTVIAEVDIVGNTASVTFSNIPTDFHTLKIVYSLRSDRSALEDGVLLSINSNTNNHARQGYNIYNGSISGFTQGSTRAVCVVPGGTAAAGLLGRGRIDFLNPSTTESRKTWMTEFEDYFTNIWTIGKVVSSLAESNPISSITLTPNLGSNFTAGRLILFGAK